MFADSPRLRKLSPALSAEAYAEACLLIELEWLISLADAGLTAELDEGERERLRETLRGGRLAEQLAAARPAAASERSARHRVVRETLSKLGLSKLSGAVGLGLSESELSELAQKSQLQAAREILLTELKGLGREILGRALRYRERLLGVELARVLGELDEALAAVSEAPLHGRVPLAVELAAPATDWRAVEEETLARVGLQSAPRPFLARRDVLTLSHALQLVALTIGELAGLLLSAQRDARWPAPPAIGSPADSLPHVRVESGSAGSILAAASQTVSAESSFWIDDLSDGICRLFSATLSLRVALSDCELDPEAVRRTLDDYSLLVPAVLALAGGSAAAGAPSAPLGAARYAEWVSSLGLPPVLRERALELTPGELAAREGELVDETVASLRVIAP